MDDCEHDQLMNEVTCAAASRGSRWQCVDCDDGHGNGIWFVFAPEDAIVLSAEVAAAIRYRLIADGHDYLLALLPKP